MKWARHVTSAGMMRNEYKLLVGRYETKRKLKGLRLRWKDDIRMNLK
jgi:hypothetical protein